MPCVDNALALLFVFSSLVLFMFFVLCRKWRSFRWRNRVKGNPLAPLKGRDCLLNSVMIGEFCYGVLLSSSNDLLLLRTCWRSFENMYFTWNYELIVQLTVLILMQYQSPDNDIMFDYLFMSCCNSLMALLL